MYRFVLRVLDSGITVPHKAGTTWSSAHPNFSLEKLILEKIKGQFEIFPIS